MTFFSLYFFCPRYMINQPSLLLGWDNSRIHSIHRRRRARAHTHTHLIFNRYQSHRGSLTTRSTGSHARTIRRGRCLTSVTEVYEWHPVWCYGLFQVVGFSKSWAFPSRGLGLFQVVGFSSRGLFQVVGFSKSWAFPSRGLFQVVGFSKSWAFPSRGIFQVVGFSKSLSCVISYKLFIFHS